MTTTRTRRPARRTSTTAKPDPYQVITDQVIALLEAGTAPWRKAWTEQAGGGFPRSMSTKKPYRGINTLILAMSAAEQGYTSQWWGTYKQIASRGGQVRKGEKGTQIVFWRTFETEDKTTGKPKVIPVLRLYTVFNADQADGDLGLPAAPAPRPARERIAECDAAVAGYLATGPQLRRHAYPAYSPSADVLLMPGLDAFDSAEEYYGALFHEATHSTGHSSRLNREGIVEDHKFGDELYSREELIAEMGAAFLAGHTGTIVATLDNTAAYLAHWVGVLKGDPKMLVQAAAKAQKAVDLILGVTFDEDAETVVEEAPALAGASV